ncbi:MAG: hypothetical protein ACRD5Z_09455 [Bryobacteraceae bacterium]
MLVRSQCGHDDVMVKLIRHGDDRDAPRRHGGEHFTEQVRAERFGIGGEIWTGQERLTGKRAAQHFVGGERLQRTKALGADPDFTDDALTLEVL